MVFASSSFIGSATPTVQALTWEKLYTVIIICTLNVSCYCYHTFYFDKYKDFSSFGKWKLFLHIPLSEIIVLEIFPKYSRSVIIREIYIHHGIN